MRITTGMLLAGLSLAVMTTACKKKDDKVSPGPGGGPPNEQELITTVKLHLYSTDGTEHLHFTWRDLDGPGGNPPVIDWDTLSAGKTYNVGIELWDESKTPAEDITEEIEDEGDEHQFFFKVEGVTLTVSYDDTDDDGKPIGLKTVWTAGGAGTGTINIVLRHEPDKDAPGVAAGDITNAGGDTDVEVTFPLVIE